MTHEHSWEQVGDIHAPVGAPPGHTRFLLWWCRGCRRARAFPETNFALADPAFRAMFQQRMADAQLTDPSYALPVIKANPTWQLAWRLSEVDNDDAPIGWARYIPMASWLLQTFTLTETRTGGRTFDERVGMDADAVQRQRDEQDPRDAE